MDAVLHRHIVVPPHGPLLIFMVYIKLIMETFQHVFKTCLLQVFVTCYTNMIPNVSFPFPYKQVKEKKVSVQWLLFLDI